jgi:tetratricopeptide (TPR) repeat protein
MDSNPLRTKLSVMLFALIFIGISAGICVIVGSAVADDTPSVDHFLASGRASLRDAQQGDKDALKEAEGQLDRALSLAPDNAQVLALHGSMLVLKGRYATLPLMKMRHVQKGLEELDRAVELDPEDLQIRSRRGTYCLKLPVIFARAETAVEDFEHLLQVAAQNTGAFSSQEQIGLRLSLAQAKLKVGDVDEARALLESILHDAPGAAHAEQARALLEDMGT